MRRILLLMPFFLTSCSKPLYVVIENKCISSKIQITYKAAPNYLELSPSQKVMVRLTDIFLNDISQSSEIIQVQENKKTFKKISSYPADLGEFRRKYVEASILKKDKYYIEYHCNNKWYIFDKSVKKWITLTGF